MHLHIFSHPRSQFQQLVFKVKLCVSFTQMDIQQVLRELCEIHCK